MRCSLFQLWLVIWTLESMLALVKSLPVATFLKLQPVFLKIMFIVEVVDLGAWSFAMVLLHTKFPSHNKVKLLL